MILVILSFIAILTLVILVHELGHFLSARYFGIRVEEFGIGFPPRLIKIKQNKMVFSINAIPLGGFVKMRGEDEEVNAPDSFSTKSLGQRFLVLISGVIFNFILAILIFSFGFGIGAPLIASTRLDHPAALEVKNKIIVMSVKKDSPASKLGLVAGDIILSLNNQTFSNSAEVSDFTKKMAGKEVKVVWMHKGEKKTAAIRLEENNAPLGIAPLVVSFVKYRWYQTVGAAFQEAVRIIKATLLAIVRMVANIFTSHRAPQEVTGPVGIFFLTREIVKLGSPFVLIFIGFLSLSLAIINILPFPALDGGRLLFLGIEKIRGKRISPRVENITHLVGFVVLITLIIFVTYYDLMRW